MICFIFCQLLFTSEDTPLVNVDSTNLTANQILNTNNDDCIRSSKNCLVTMIAGPTLSHPRTFCEWIWDYGCDDNKLARPWKTWGTGLVSILAAMIGGIFYQYACNHSTSGCMNYCKSIGVPMLYCNLTKPTYGGAWSGDQYCQCAFPCGNSGTLCWQGTFDNICYINKYFVEICNNNTNLMPTWVGLGVLGLVMFDLILGRYIRGWRYVHATENNMSASLES